MLKRELVDQLESIENSIQSVRSNVVDVIDCSTSQSPLIGILKHNQERSTSNEQNERDKSRRVHWDTQEVEAEATEEARQSWREKVRACVQTTNSIMMNFVAFVNNVIDREFTGGRRYQTTSTQ